MSGTPYEPVLEITRGTTVESIQYGAAAVVDSTGQLLASYGDPQVVTFLRSSAKPFQALPFLENGGAEAFGLIPQEIALICSSHSGTDEHVAVVRGIQAKTGVFETDLLCGTHPPSDKTTAEALLQRGEKPTPNRHNCSGKHTGMLAYSLLKKLPIHPEEANPPYIDPSHPVQQEILQTFADMCDLSPDMVAFGIDGCSVPTFGVPLQRAALAYARLCDPRQLPEPRRLACEKITRAMTGNPDMVGGPDSFDTHLMNAGRGKVLCKGGAEGYQALGVMPGALGPGSPGLGIALKISDGDLGAHSRPAGDPFGHARPAVALEILKQTGIFSEKELVALQEYGPSFIIQNWRKLNVGQARPCFELRRNGDHGA